MSQSLCVFHGTGSYAIDGFCRRSPDVAARPYLDGRAAFATTSVFAVAARFAVAKSSVEELWSGRIGGVVLEFELRGVVGRDYVGARDQCLANESELAVFRPECLTWVALWRYVNGGWVRGARPPATVPADASTPATGSAVPAAARRRRPSRTQWRSLRDLGRRAMDPEDARDLNGNAGRTLKSLLDNGWASWSAPPQRVVLTLTEAGRAALERGRAKYGRAPAALGAR